MDIYVLDSTLNLVGIVDAYESCIWRPAYSDIGDFELYLPVSRTLIDMLKLNRYLVRATDVSNSGYKKVMIIKNLEIITDVENGDYLKVTGRELKYLLHQRIVWEQTTLTGTAENAIRQLIAENAISPTNANRTIPHLILGTLTGFAETIEKQVTAGEYLDTVIADICKAYNYGWELSVDGFDMVVNLYTGLDRSYDQTDRPFVIFSPDFDNLYSTDYQLNTEGFANCTLVGGEGEGSEQKFTEVNDNLIGLNRFETYTNASSVSSNADSETPIPLAQYIELLKQQGAENLANLAYTEGFSGEVLSDVTFKFGRDFFLGDTVTVVNAYGISKNVRVLSAIESEDASGYKLIPQFNI